MQTSIRPSIGRASILFAVALVAVSVSGFLPASASDVGAHGVHGPPPAGYYHSFFSGGSSSYMNFYADSTWDQQISHGLDDTGVWVSQGKVVALAVTSHGNAGCVYLGQTTRPGISTKHKPGQDFCPFYDYYPSTWYSCFYQTSKCYFSSPAARTRRAPSADVARGSSVVGSYSIFWQGVSGSLTINSDNTWNATFTEPDSYSDSGYWVTGEKSVALTVDAGSFDAGCLFLGVVKGSSINTGHKQGPFSCGNITGTWYAKAE